MCIHGKNFFLQDRAPCHKSKMVMDVLMVDKRKSSAFRTGLGTA
jgi:hypothetical protein